MMRYFISILLAVTIFSFSTEALAVLVVEHWVEARESVEEEQRELQESVFELGVSDKLAAAGGANIFDLWVDLSSFKALWKAPQKSCHEDHLQHRLLIYYLEQVELIYVFVPQVLHQKLYQWNQQYLFYG